MPQLRDVPGVLVVYVALGAVLWALPLVRVLHAESAAVVAAVAFFAAGWSSVRLRQQGWPLAHVLAVQELALLVPWAMLTASLLWAPNCDYVWGLLFYVLFPGVTVMLAVAVAHALVTTGWHCPRMTLAGIGVAVAVLGPVYDLGFHPQFYTYNHVFGGVLGPIYDEELAVRPGLFTFRAMTLLWALLAVLAARLWKRRRRPGARRCAARIGAGVVATLLVLGYVFAGPLGINTPERYLQAQLGGHLRTAHFDIYYDPEALEPAALRRLAEDHEYRYDWLAERLDMEGPRRIASYLYPDADAKAALTGARYTSVAPVWLGRAQVHLLQERYAPTFGHELVHAFSREFGLPVVRASLAVGLVEGLAVAAEPPNGLPAPPDQVLAAALAGQPPDDPLELADDVAARLSPAGFWTGRGAVSYTTMGAFVRYLLDGYGAERLRRVYARGNFEAVYGRSVADLAREWERSLAAMRVTDADAGPLATRRFARPSLFERRCPHHVPDHVRAYRTGAEALAGGDTSRARRAVDEALAARPGWAEALVLAARLDVASGRPQRALQRVAAGEGGASAALVRGDAHALLGRPDSARAAYRYAREQVPGYEHQTQALLLLREMLAGRPDAVAVVAGVGASEAEARALAGLPRPSDALRVLQAVLLLEAAPAQSAALLEGLAGESVGDDPFARAALARALLRWQATAAYRAGRAADARDYARRAAGAYRDVGALNEAAVWDDYARKMEWLLRRGDQGGGVRG